MLLSTLSTCKRSVGKGLNHRNFLFKVHGNGRSCKSCKPNGEGCSKNTWYGETCATFIMKYLWTMWGGLMPRKNDWTYGFSNLVKNFVNVQTNFYERSYIIREISDVWFTEELSFYKFKCFLLSVLDCFSTTSNSVSSRWRSLTLLRMALLRSKIQFYIDLNNLH